MLILDHPMQTGVGLSPNEYSGVELGHKLFVVVLMNLHNLQQTKLLTHAKGLGKVLGMLGGGHVSNVEAVLKDHGIP